MNTQGNCSGLLQLEKARQSFADSVNVLPLSEPAKRLLFAAASSWARAAATAARLDAGGRNNRGFLFADLAADE